MGWMYLREPRIGPTVVRALRRSAVAFSAFSVLLGVTAGQALAVDGAASKCDRVVLAKLKSKSDSGWSDLIVRLDGDLTASRRATLVKMGATIHRQLSAIDAVAMKLPTRNLGKLGELPWVERISHDFRVQKSDDFTVGHTFADWGWNPGGFDGGGVNVAVLDSGIQRAQDFSGSSYSSRRIHHVDFSAGIHDLAGESDLGDPCGHGTHVAGIIAGNSKSAMGLNARTNFYGSAPKANLLSVRVLERDGSGTVSNVLAGMQWILDNKAAWNIKVVNISLGHAVGESYVDDPLCMMVEQLWKRGIVVVVAAGNMGRLNEENDPTLNNEGWGTAYGSIASPGNSPYVITVGAMKRMPDNIRVNDKIATYSSRGPSIFDYVMKPDLVAPGNKVLSVGPNGGFLFQTYSRNILSPSSYLFNPSLARPDDNGYYVLSGTSMAAPAVAGTVAQMLDKEPWLNPDTIKARLMVTADKWTHPAELGSDDGEILMGDPLTFGAGFLNAYAALNSSLTTTGHALSPKLMLDDKGNLILNLEGCLSDLRAIWGTGIFDLRAVWGVRAIWGTGTPGSTRAIWGLEAGRVGGNRAIWGTTQQVQIDRAIWGSGGPQCDLSSIALDGEN